MAGFRGLRTVLVTAIAVPALIFAASYLPGTRFLPYFALLVFFWGIYLVPVALVMLAVHLLRRRPEGHGGPLSTFVGGYAAVMLGLGVYLATWAYLQGSTRYMLVGGKSPYHLTASTMAGFDTVTLGIKAVEEPGIKQATAVTASASDIAAENARASIGQRYALRLISASPDVTWTIEPGEGVHIDGERTIAPGTYRDFTVTTSGSTVTMKSGSTGTCPLDRDPNDCSR